MPSIASIDIARVLLDSVQLEGVKAGPMVTIVGGYVLCTQSHVDLFSAISARLKLTYHDYSGSVWCHIWRVSQDVRPQYMMVLNHRW